MKGKIKSKNIIIFSIILFLFLFIDSIIALGLITIENKEKLTLIEGIIITLAKYFILIIIFIIQYKDYLKKKIIDFKNNIGKYFEISFKNWLLGFLIMIGSNIIINKLVPGLGQNESSVQELITKLPFLAFILTTIFAPFTEEMVFRKYLQDCFNNKILYMIVSGIIFGLVHVMGFGDIREYLLIIPYGALGFMFAKTINETDNIYCTIMMHMIHNGALTLLSIMSL